MTEQKDELRGYMLERAEFRCLGEIPDREEQIDRSRTGFGNVKQRVTDRT